MQPSPYGIVTSAESVAVKAFQQYATGYDKRREEQ